MVSANMTVTSLSNRITYAGNGSTTSFPFAFKVASAADLTAIWTDATGTDHTLAAEQYGVSGLGLEAGGSVTYPLSGAPIAAGTRLTLLRDPAPLQAAQLANQGALWPAVIEAALDRLTWIAQRLGDGQRRSLAVAPSESVPLNLLPPAPQRANSLLGFDAAGQPYAARLATGLTPEPALVSSWLLANFLGMSSRAAALGALGGAGTADDNAMTGTSDFTAGRIKVPTRAAADSGTDAASTAMVQAALASFAATMGGTVAATGSYSFANGLIAKWGTSGSIAASGNATVTFAAAFPAALFGVVLTPLANSSGWASNHAAASFRINNGSGGSAAFFWLAFGN
jgi:hypothetical protein